MQRLVLPLLVVLADAGIAPVTIFSGQCVTVGLVRQLPGEAEFVQRLPHAPHIRFIRPVVGINTDDPPAWVFVERGGVHGGDFRAVTQLACFSRFLYGRPRLINLLDWGEDKPLAALLSGGWVGSRFALGVKPGEACDFRGLAVGVGHGQVALPLLKRLMCRQGVGVRVLVFFQRDKPPMQPNAGA